MQHPPTVDPTQLPPPASTPPEPPPPPGGRPDRTAAEDTLPGWLIDAAERLPRGQRGVALGFAAAGFVAGQQAAASRGEENTGAVH